MKSLIIGMGIFGFLVLAVAILFFRPVPIIAEEYALVETGKVDSIYEAGIKDVVFLLDNTERRFYINRGLENGLDLDTLRYRLKGQIVTFKYPKYWTPLDWDNEIKHLSKVELNGEVIFNELK